MSDEKAPVPGLVSINRDNGVQTKMKTEEPRRVYAQRSRSAEFVPGLRNAAACDNFAVADA